MIPPNPTAASPIQCRVAFVPYQPVNFRPEPPTAASWRFLRENANVTGVRLQYLYDDPRWWDGAFAAALDGGMEVHGNFCVGNTSKLTPALANAQIAEIESVARAWTNSYAMASVSFSNEPGYAPGFVMADYTQNFWLPFYRGVRRANPTIPIYGCDAESVETQATFEAMLLKLFPGKTLRDILAARGVHNYGDQSDGDGLHYAKMIGDSEPGFADLSAEIPTWNTEVDNQQNDSARQREKDTVVACLAAGMKPDQAAAYGRSARTIASDEEIDKLTAFSILMRDKFHLPVITFGSGEFFCTRVPVTPWITPPQTWSTWTHNPERPRDPAHPEIVIPNLPPVMSESGKRLAAVFAPVKPAPQQGRRPGRRG